MRPCIMLIQPGIAQGVTETDGQHTNALSSILLSDVGDFILEHNHERAMVADDHHQGGLLAPIVRELGHGIAVLRLGQLHVTHDKWRVEGWQMTVSIASTSSTIGPRLGVAVVSFG
jgi:predicted HD phosphohydrolase